MEISRGQLLRSLALAKSVGSNEALISTTGDISAASESGSVTFFGKTISPEQDLGLIDVNLLLNMVAKTNQKKITATITRRVLKIVDGDSEFGYKLADADILEVPNMELIEKYNGLVGLSFKVKVEATRRIADLIRTIMAKQVVFKSSNGDLKVVVGKEEMFYGKVSIQEGLGLKDNLEVTFLADELVAVLNVLDFDEIEFGLSFGENPNGLKFLKIAQEDSIWYIGANIETHTEKKEKPESE